MVEYLHPGVYVTEVPFQAKPIEGVSTSTAPFDPLRAAARDAHAPDWTQHNNHDPGVTLVQMFGWVSESSLFGAARMHASVGHGVVQGLAVGSRDTGSDSDLRVSAGRAVAADGRVIATESDTSAHRVKKP